MRDASGKDLRGPSAWEAARKAMAKRNDEARDRAQEKRSAHAKHVDEAHRAARARQKD